MLLNDGLDHGNRLIIKSIDGEIIGLLEISDLLLTLVIRSLKGFISVSAQLLEPSLEIFLDLKDQWLQAIFKFFNYRGMGCLLSSNALFVSSRDGFNNRVNFVAIFFLLLVLISRLLRLSRLNLLLGSLLYLGLFFLDDRLWDDLFDLRNWRLNLLDLLLDGLRLSNDDRLGLWLLVHDDTAVGNEPLSAPILAVTGAKSVHL